MKEHLLSLGSGGGTLRSCGMKKYIYFQKVLFNRQRLFSDTHPVLGASRSL
jgi:hypothetical protein